MRAALAFGALGALLAAAAPAHALEAPQPLPRDKRVRVIPYDRDEVVQLYTAVGSSVRIEIAQDETVEALLVSDQAVMSGEVEVEGEGETVGASHTQTQGQVQGAPGKTACVATGDGNMNRSVCGAVIYLKPLRELEPQPLHLQTRRCEPAVGAAPPKCGVRLYQFELLTRPGPLTEAAPNTVYAVRFDYPADRAAAERAKAEADAARRRANAQAAARRAAAGARQRAEETNAPAAEALLRAQQGAALNQAYTVRGDRAVLGAPR